VPQSLDGFPRVERSLIKRFKPLIKRIKPPPTVPQSLGVVPAGPRPGQKGLNLGQKALNR
jgi:hypothetical protein